SKLYLKREARGSGAGRLTMERIERFARGRGLGSIWLTVNKRNPSVRAYQRMGFAITADLCTDVGAGFVMDDYRMEKAITSPSRSRGPGARRSRSRSSSRESPSQIPRAGSGRP